MYAQLLLNISNLSPAYMNDVFTPSGQSSTTSRESLLKLN